MTLRWELNCSDADGERRQALVGSATVEVEATDMELIAAAEDSTSPGTIRMRCVPYGEPGPHWRGSVKFKAGCFKESLESLGKKETKAYIADDAHELNPTKLLANSLSNATRGTVTYTDKRDGLWADVVLPNTSAGRDVAELVGIGTIDSCSIGVLIEEYVSVRTQDDEEMEEMTITNAVNRETSLVARPRFEGAKVRKLRSDDDDDDNGEVTTSLYDAFSNKVDEAIALITALVASQHPSNHIQLVPDTAEDTLEATEIPDNVLPLPIRLARKHLNKGEDNDN